MSEVKKVKVKVKKEREKKREKKSCPSPHHEGIYGEQALDGSEWSTLRSGHFIPSKES